MVYKDWDGNDWGGADGMPRAGEPVQIVHDLPEVRVEPVKYTVCALPEGNVNARHYALQVQYQGQGQWAVVWIDSCLGSDGTWSEGVKPYGRGEHWLKRHRFDLATALQLAREAAPHVVVNGFSVGDVLAAEKEKN